MGTHRKTRGLCVLASGIFLLAAGSRAAEDVASCTAGIAALARTAQAKPGSTEAQLALGVKRFRCGQAAAALEPLKISIQLAPNNSSAYFYLGVSLLALDREEEARNAFKRMAALTPPDDEQLYLLLRGYAKLSSALAERLHAVAPDSYRLQEMEGEYFDAQNRPELALDKYKLAVQKQPGAASAHYLLGSAYWVRFRSDEARPSSVCHQAQPGTIWLVKIGDDSARAGESFRGRRRVLAALNMQPGLQTRISGWRRRFISKTNRPRSFIGDRPGIEIDPQP